VLKSLNGRKGVMWGGEAWLRWIGTMEKMSNVSRSKSNILHSQGQVEVSDSECAQTYSSSIPHLYCPPTFQLSAVVDIAW
jgi:hypothetical protein